MAKLYDGALKPDCEGGIELKNFLTSIRSYF